MNIRLWMGLFLVFAGSLALVRCSDSSESPAAGTEGGECYPNGTCNSGLTCLSGLCVDAGGSGPGDDTSGGACQPDCSGRECGPDPVCEESCGTCAAGEDCQGGQCATEGPDDTWIDPSSGLTWQVKPTGGMMEWDAAESHCSTLGLDGGGWRLPTISELRSLIRGCPVTEVGGSCNVADGECIGRFCRDEGLCNGCSGLGPSEGCDWPDGITAACACYWPDGVAGTCAWYWSVSPEDDHGGVWVVGFDTAWVASYDADELDDGGSLVRCVR